MVRVRMVVYHLGFLRSRPFDGRMDWHLVKNIPIHALKLHTSSERGPNFLYALGRSGSAFDGATSTVKRRMPMDFTNIRT